VTATHSETTGTSSLLVERMALSSGPGVMALVTLNRPDEMNPLDWDTVKAFAHAVVRPSDGLLWMPYSVSKGRWKVARWISIACLWLALFVVLLFGVFHLVRPVKDGYLSFLIEYLPYQLVGSLLLGGGVFWSSLDDAKYAERILKVLGFKNPKIVNLSPFSEARLHKGASYMVYDLRAALRAYGSLSKAKPQHTANTP